MEHIWTVALIILYLGHNFTWAEYFVVGKNITLRPPPGTTDITGILWNHNENLVAEWAKGDLEVEYYGSFRDRADLNTVTGSLVINPTTEADVGVYTVEINKKLLEGKYEFASVQEVPKPKIWVRPGVTEEERTLSCDGDVSKAGPVTFWWDITKDRSWVRLDRRITLKKNETTERMERFSCKMVNPAGEKESEPHDNPFLVRRDLSALGALVLLPILAGAVFVGYKKRTAIKQCFCPEGEAVRNGTGENQAQVVPLTEGNGEKGPKE